MILLAAILGIALGCTPFKNYQLFQYSGGAV